MRTNRTTGSRIGALTLSVLCSALFATGALVATAVSAEESGSAAKTDPCNQHPVTKHCTEPGHQSGATSSGASAAEQATDPSAILAQVQNFFTTTSTDEDNNVSNTYLLQPVLPLTKKNVLRPALPVISTGGPDGKSGIGDLFLLDIQIEQFSKGSWGWGAAGTLDTASDDTLGGGKWTAGPAGMYLYKGIPKTIFGILGYNTWSFAGDNDREDVNTLFFQPIFVRHTSWGYWGWTDQNVTVDWEHDNNISFPVGIRFGKVFKASAKTLLNVAVMPYYSFNDNRDDTYGLKLTANFVKPGWLKH